MTGALPQMGQPVRVHDPLGYTGTGLVAGMIQMPHPCVLVRMETITDRADASVLGHDVWVLAPHVSPHVTDTPERSAVVVDMPRI